MMQKWTKTLLTNEDDKNNQKKCKRDTINGYVYIEKTS